MQSHHQSIPQFVQRTNPTNPLVQEGTKLRSGLEAELSNTRDRIEKQNSQLSSILSRVNRLADQCLGSQAETGAQGAPAATPNGFCQAIEMELAVQSRFLADIEKTLERLGA